MQCDIHLGLLGVIGVERPLKAAGKWGSGREGDRLRTRGSSYQVARCKELSKCCGFMFTLSARARPSLEL